MAQASGGLPEPAVQCEGVARVKPGAATGDYILPDGTAVLEFFSDGRAPQRFEHLRATGRELIFDIGFYPG